MHLKLGKSFPLLKFKPDILHPLRLDQDLVVKQKFDINDPIYNFQDLMRIDCTLGLVIDQIKIFSQKYIQSVKAAQVEAMKDSRKQLKKKLELLLKYLQKLEFQNIEKDISQLFRGPYGLYTLYRYLWNPDILLLLMKIKQGFQQKPEKQNDGQIQVYYRKNNRYCEVIEQMMHKQGKVILKQFIRQMYIIPDQWGIKLCRNIKEQSQIQQIFNSEEQNNIKLQRLLRIFAKKQNNQPQKFKNVLKALFYFDLQNSFYSYLGLLKCLILNKVSGIFNGDYESWQQIYDICLKIYARKENFRGQNGIQIDQIIQHQIQDQQFTNFMTKSKIQSISLSAMNFYYKNCPKSVKNNLKNVIGNKIKSVLQQNCFKQYQDISQYLDTEANQQQRKHAIQLIRIALIRILNTGIKKSQYFQAHKAIDNMVQYLIKSEQSFFSIFNLSLLQQIKKALQRQRKSQNKILVYFIYSLINTIMIQCYQQQFDFTPYILQHEEYQKILKIIAIQLKKAYNLQVHQDACSIISELKKIRKQDDSQSQGQDQKKDKNRQSDQYQEQFSQLVSNLMLISGRDCQFKLQNCLYSQQNKEIIANQITKLFKKLSDSQFQQRSEIEKYLTNKMITQYTKQQRYAIQTYLIYKGFKDRLLHQNIINLSVKMHPVISFAEVATFAVEFITFMTPSMIDQPLTANTMDNYTNIDPFDVCDIISGEQPIQCMKLIYKKVQQFDETTIDFQVFNKLPFQLLKNISSISNNRAQLAKQVVQTDNQLSIGTFDQIEELKKFLFYAELMNKVFSKLNEKSQKGIKQIKVIFNGIQKICVKIWQHSASKIISSQIYSICQKSQQFHQRILKMNEPSQVKPKILTSEAVQYSQIIFNKLIKSIKLPYTDSVLVQDNYITKICQEFICFSISKVLHPLNFFTQYQKLFNPLQIVKIEQIQQKNSKITVQFKQNYQLLGQIIKALAMIQYTCSNQQAQQNRQKQDQKQWFNKWRKNCLQISDRLISIINKSNEQLILDTKCEARSKSLWVSVFLVHLKAQVIKILIPYLIKDPLKYPLENPKNYNTQLQQTFNIFSSLCEIVEKISPGQQDHLMTFLQIFQNFDTGSNKNLQSNSKTSQFLYKAIQTLLGLVFKGIRVRSYHFYKFIKSYLKLTKQKQNYFFFNSVIGFYTEKLMKDIVPQFKLPETIISFCDQNLNHQSKTNNMQQKENIVSKQILINENNLIKSVNKIRFTKFTRFETKFQLVAQKVCVISMFMNLFCRLNFKTLTEGIEKIWQSQQMHLIYLDYLKKISNLLSSQYKTADQKLFDIVNVDCFGNLSIIMRNHMVNSRNYKQKQNHRLIQQTLKLIKQVLKSNIKLIVKNSLKIPVKIIMSQLKNSSTSIQTIDFISKVIQQLSLSKCSLIPSNQNASKQPGNPYNDCQQSCSQILDMILACYNIRLSRGISSNVHVNNLTYICNDSDLKLRVLQNNMNSLQRRMNRKQIRTILQKYNKKQQSSIKLKGRRSSINKKMKSQQKNNEQLQMQTWVSISSHSQKLIKQIIQNFIISYYVVFKQFKSDPTNKDTIQTLFNNLKILSLVTLNNPQIVTYLLQYQILIDNNSRTLYEVMIDSATVCLPIFLQLYLAFIKTNYGFVRLEQEQKELMPYNFIIQTNIKRDLLLTLQRQLKNTQQTNKIKILLKTLLTITKLSNMSSKQNFRSYKFGNICNRKYAELYAKYQNKFYNELAYILRNAIEQFNGVFQQKSTLSENCLQLLMLFQETINKLLKESDLAWMKLNLDVQLKKSPNDIEIKNNQNKIEQQMIPQAKNTKIETKISYQFNQSSRQSNSFLTYSFQMQLINQQMYNFLNKSVNSDKNSSQLLQKMIQYSSKQSIWDGAYDDDTILLQYPTNRSSGQSSFGITLPSSENDSNQNENLNLRPNQNTVNSYNIVNDQIKQQQTQKQTQNKGNQEHFDCMVEDQVVQDLSENSISKIDNRHRTNGNHIQQQQDGIIQYDQPQPQNDYIVQQLHKCMSQTSLQFLSQHSVKIDQISQKSSHILQNQPQIQHQITKNHLLSYYQQYCINPQGKKNLLNAISQANVMQLEKFIANQAVDQEIEMLVVRELWGRGIVPSCTSISKNNKYYGNLNINNKIANPISIYISQAVIYKRMHDSYTKTMQHNPTNKYIPILHKQVIQYILIQCITKIHTKQHKNQTYAWIILNKLCLQAQNMYNVMEVTLSYISLTDNQISEKINKLLNSNKQNQMDLSNFKLKLINNLISGLVKFKIGLRLLFTFYWNSTTNKIISYNQQNLHNKSDNVPILLFILQEASIIQQTIKGKKNNQNENVQSVVHCLWQYFQKCDEFKAHSKLQNNKRQQQAQYPYYQIQQSINVCELFIKKIVDRLFNSRTLVGNRQQNKNQSISSIQELFMILIYLDPKSFQAYFKQVINKISTRLNEMLKKQQKILSNFQSNWLVTEKTFLQMQKQQKYWNLRQSKKSMSSYQQQLQYFRNILVDISVNLLPKFKKVRFNYHCGKSYRDWRLQIQIIKEKLLTSGSIEGLVKLQDKQKELEDWRRNQSNQIINQQILPIVQEHTQQFIKVLMQAQSFINEFIQTFPVKQHKQKIVIYNSCAKLYEILLACQILTQQQKQTYHSMSKLKTSQSIESTKNMHNRRKSSLQANRRSARISINACTPKVNNILKKIGTSCTFLHNYIGHQEQIRQLHARYSDVNKRLKVLWVNRSQPNPDYKPEKQKIIQCRRAHVIEDTMCQIDQNFINLPVKIRFQGQIGIDYGGVTRQWITLFMKQIINPQLGLFSLSANKLTFQPNKNSHIIPNHLGYFRKIGILVGKAMKQNWLLQINLTKSFLKHVLGSTLYVEDLEDIDPQTTKSLKWILSNDIGYNDDLGLNFTYQFQLLGRKQTVQLVPGGQNIPITQDNKKQYVKLVAKAKMTEQIREQSKAFMNGLESVIPYSTLSLFSYKQISLYLSGMPTIDVKQMKQYARYQNLTPQSQEVIWFWQIVLNWSQQQLANLLFFLTGSYKVPYGGFKEQPIGFNKLINSNDYLPVAHTCFSVIDISTYSNKDKMEKMLKRSIKQGKGFSIS